MSDKPVDFLFEEMRWKNKQFIVLVADGKSVSMTDEPQFLLIVSARNVISECDSIQIQEK